MTLVLRMADGTTVTAQAEKPTSPGIFRALIRPATPGTCSLSLSVQRPQATDEIEAGPCEIFPDVRAARRARYRGTQGQENHLHEGAAVEDGVCDGGRGERELQPACMPTLRSGPSPGGKRAYGRSRPGG